MMRLLMPFAILLLFIPIQVINAQNNLYVALGGVDAPNCTDSTNPCATIDYAISWTDPGDIINLAPGAYTETFIVSTEITIQGEPGEEENTIIQAHENRGDATSRVILVGAAGDLTLANVTVRHGNDTLMGGVGGGGILNNGGELNLQNSIIADNNSAARGGGISTDGGGQIVLNNTTVIGNIAAGTGGGIYSDATLTIENNSIISDNESEDAGGGVFSNTDQTVTISNSTISGNKSGAAGGGINQAGGSGAYQISESRIENNEAVGLGGGMSSLGPLQIEQSVIADNESDFNGGGLAITNVATITNSFVTGNDSGNSGGGISVGGTSSNLTLVGSLITGNIANNGGGISHDEIAASSLTNVTISGNSARFGGGGIFNIRGSSPTLTNVILWGNRADSEGDQINNSATGLNLPQISHSLIEGSGGSGGWDIALGTDIGNNLDADPLFTDPELASAAPTSDGDYTVAGPTSPVINAGETPGDLSIFPGEPGDPVDLAGNPRVDGAAIDMGAYEFEGDPEIPGAFITTWQTDNPGDSGDDQIRIPLFGDGYDFTVHWGDGNSDDFVLNPGEMAHFVEHTYGFAGTYTVTITGIFPQIYFNDGGDKEKILTVEQWGDIEWRSMERAFFGASNLQINASDAPDLSIVTNMFLTFAGASSLNSDLDHWNVSNVELMISTFRDATAFNGNIGSWNVSNVINMTAMFFNASLFNQDLHLWDVSDVTSMSNMFWDAASFNGNISTWQVGEVTNMSGMFAGASSFNSDISLWNTGKVEDMFAKFFGTPFNQDIGGWNTENVTNMRQMFSANLVFNHDISLWETGEVTTMREMFSLNPQFNQDISGWNTSNVEDMDLMFFNTSAFDQNLGNWNIESVTTMSQMLNSSGLSRDNYDATLISWSAQNVQEGVTLGAEGLEYCAEVERQVLTDPPNNWTINDAGLSAACGLTCPVAGGGTLFVKSGEAGTGISWADAMGELRDALNLLETGACTAADVDEIWVADGVYLPTDDAMDRDATFRLFNGVAIYGGFAGDEASVDDRNLSTPQTFLSGNIAGLAGGPIFDPDDLGDFSYSVVTASGTDETAILDGFVITGGHSSDAAAADESPGKSGAAIYNDSGSPVLRNLWIVGNKASAGAGGILNIDNASPEIVHVTLSNNEAAYGGGMVNDSDSNPVIIGSWISANRALFHGGGMVNSHGSNPELYSVLIANNHAEDGFGGGVWNRSAEATFVNVTIANNTSTTHGGGIYNEDNTELTFTNSILWGNDSADTGKELFNSGTSTAVLLHSIYRDEADMIAAGGGFTPDVQTLTDNHYFQDIDANDFRLIVGSEAMFTGDPAAIPGFAMQDVFQNPRIVEGQIDRGAIQSPGFLMTPAPPNQSAVLGEEYSPIEITVEPRTDTGFDLDAGDWGDLLTSIVWVSYPAAGPSVNFEGDPDNPFFLVFSFGSVTTPVPTATGDAGVFDITFTMNGAVPVTVGMENLDALAFDTPRILASNRSDFVFSVADFGAAHSVRIEILPDRGQLLLNGVPVAVNESIATPHIMDGNLIWSHSTDDYGFRYTEIAGHLLDDLAVEIGQFEVKIDLAAAFVDIEHDGEGWRFMTSPVIGETFASLLDPIYTQGIPGSNNPGAAFPNVYRIDQANYQWEVPGHMDEEIGIGEAFIVYVFSDDDGSGTPDGFPKTLLSGETWLDLADGFEFPNLDFDPDPAGVNPDNFHLIANPHPLALNFCSMLIFFASEVRPFIHFWDPSANGGNGDYVEETCLIAPPIHIAPFQAFWVRTFAANPELSTGLYLETMEDGFFKEHPETVYSGIANLDGDQVNPFGEVMHASFEVTSEDGVFTNRTNLLFSDEGTLGTDRFDLTKLNASGLAQRWISFHTLDDTGREYAFRSLPIDFGEQISILLDIQTTEDGWFELSWNLPQNQQTIGDFWLRDNETGQILELMQEQYYRFEIEKREKRNTIDVFPLRSTSPMFQNAKKSGENYRFELLVTRGNTDGLSLLGDIPDRVHLAQNYPNPFNPTTIINFELPQQSQVRIDVFDMIGRHVSTLVDNNTMQAGRHQINFDASGLTSGIYIYRLQAGSTVLSRRLTVIK